MADYFEDFKLKVFLTVARLGSFTLAARELGVSQPAVSQNINSLEKNLGVQLLERRPGEVFLTDAGRSFISYAHKINYWYDAAGRMFGERGLATIGRPVKISADEVTANYILPRALADIFSSNPDLAFEVTACGDAGESGDIFGGKACADVEITVSPSPKTMDFEWENRLAGIMEPAVVASAANREMFRVATEENARQPFSTIAGVHVSNNFAVWEGYRGLLSPDILSRVSVFSCSVELIKSMVLQSGHLVGIVPEPAVRAQIRDGILVTLPVNLPEFIFDIRFAPTDDFAGKQVCKLLKEALLRAK